MARQDQDSAGWASTLRASLRRQEHGPAVALAPRPAAPAALAFAAPAALAFTAPAAPPPPAAAMTARPPVALSPRSRLAPEAASVGLLESLRAATARVEGQQDPARFAAPLIDAEWTLLGGLGGSPVPRADRQAAWPGLAAPGPATEAPPAAQPEAMMAPVIPPADPVEGADWPLSVAAIATAYAGITGKPPAAPAELAASLFGPDWVALAESLVTAQHSWRALLLGYGMADFPVAAAIAASEAGLLPQLLITEADAGRADQMREALKSKAPRQTDDSVLTTRVSAAPDALPEAARSVQDLLRREAVWDLCRIGERSLLRHLLQSDTPLLTERVRWLMLLPQDRSEEAAAIRLLSRHGWKLAAERPALLRQGARPETRRRGAQLWRGPLA